MGKPTEDFEEEVKEFDAEKIIEETKQIEKRKDEKIQVSEKAKAEFKRVPNYSPRKCYKFDVVCSKKCLLWNDCSKKGKWAENGRIHKEG